MGKISKFKSEEKSKSNFLGNAIKSLNKLDQYLNKILTSYPALIEIVDPYTLVPNFTEYLRSKGEFKIEKSTKFAILEGKLGMVMPVYLGERNIGQITLYSNLITFDGYIPSKTSKFSLKYEIDSGKRLDDIIFLKFP